MADGRYTAEAYKLAIVAYQAILADLEAPSARGFCRVAPTLAFETVGGRIPDVLRMLGSVPLGRVRSASVLGRIAPQADMPFWRCASCGASMGVDCRHYCMFMQGNDDGYPHA
ncbi:hypothetical protein DXU03_31965 [Rhizobium johnstonii]|nr:hypothetical protein ELG65_38215 [Rhizobium leguminosarum]